MDQGRCKQARVGQGNGVKGTLSRVEGEVGRASEPSSPKGKVSR